MADRPLRRDAERNRQRLITVAADLMAREGLDVSYEQIAHAAGMGMGTVYRRFPEREDLFDAIFGRHIDTVVSLAEEAAGHDDAWAGLCWFMTRQLELEATDRALGQLLRGRSQPARLSRHAREQIAPRVTTLVQRAVSEGRLPAATTPLDFAMVHLMVGAVMDADRDRGDDLWRRALTIALSGIHAADHHDAAPADELIDHLYSRPTAGPQDTETP